MTICAQNLNIEAAIEVKDRIKMTGSSVRRKGTHGVR